MSGEMEDRSVLSRADQALLKSALAPSDAQLAAARSALAGRIAALAAGAAATQAASTAEAATTVSSAAATTASTKGVALLGAAKWIGAGLLASAIATGAVVATQREARVTRAKEQPQPAVQAAPTDPTPAIAPANEPAKTPVASSTATRELEVARPMRARRPTAAPAAGTLADELALIRSARAALERGDAQAALGELDAHAARYAKPMLHQEALAARARALCALGRSQEARRAAAKLERVAPRSPHLIGLAGSCARDVDE